MSQEVRRLQQEVADLEKKNRFLLEANSCIEQKLTSLIRDGQEAEIIRRLKGGESYNAVADWLQHRELRPSLLMTSSVGQSLHQIPTMTDEGGEVTGGKHWEWRGGKGTRVEIQHILNE